MIDFVIMVIKKSGKHKMPLCKVCQENTSSMKDVKKELVYYRCISCGFVSLDDACMVDNTTERKHYEKHNNTLECTGYVQMFEEFINISVLEYKESIQTVLDFGCGEEAVLAHLLEEKGFEVDVYDIYFHSKKVYEHKQYDLIISTEVFEHLQEPKVVLKTLVHSLNSNGYIILMTKFPPKDDKEFLAWWYRRDITHISFFTPKSLEVMGNEVGLRVLKTINENVVIFQKIDNLV